MPQDLPGFYYDAEKNRYFPIKGPIPGSSRTTSTSAQKSIIEPEQGSKAHKRLGSATAKLLQIRELNGNIITSTKGKYNFREEYTKSRASEPTIWGYHGTDRIADCALEQLLVDINMSDGAVRREILLAGGLNGSLCSSIVGEDMQQIHYGVRSIPHHVWPLDTKKKEGLAKSPLHLWKPDGASINMRSTISSIQKFRKNYLHAADSASSTEHVLITTLGSETSGGSVFTLNLGDVLEHNSGVPIIWRRMNRITSFNCTVWTADCNVDGARAVIGTNLGAAVVNIETGTLSWICRCKSDVFSVQMDHSGNIALCGLRNGAIVTVDVRQRPEGSARFTRQRILYPSHKGESSRRNTQKTRQWFELKGNICHSGTISMPSSVSCLASLKLYNQYFLGSSMDGSIKLYDHRMNQRGAVQSYEGNVNSHSRIQLGVDPSEKFIVSGGEDCKLRLWSLKSGELLFEEKIMNSIPTVVCWQRNEDIGAKDYTVDYEPTHFEGAWIGSQGGIFHMRWS